MTDPLWLLVIAAWSYTAGYWLCALVASEAMQQLANSMRTPAAIAENTAAFFTDTFALIERTIRKVVTR